MAPGMEQMVEEHPQVDLVLLNVDNPSWQPQVQRWNVNGIPHLQLFDANGESAGQSIGLRQPQELSAIAVALETGEPSHLAGIGAISSLNPPMTKRRDISTTLARAATAKLSSQLLQSQPASDQHHERPSAPCLGAASAMDPPLDHNPASEGPQIPSMRFSQARGSCCATITAAPTAAAQRHWRSGGRRRLRERNQHSWVPQTANSLRLPAPAREMARSAC